MGQFKTKWNTTEKIKQIKIIDISGKIVFASDATILQSHIDISDLTTGLYFIQLETSNKTYTEKLIKQQPEYRETFHENK